MLSKFLIAMMIVYPLVAYAALWLEQPLFIISYLMLILFLFTIEKCRTKHWYTGAILLSIIILIIYLIQQAYTQYLLYLPPILILFSLFLFFSQSLSAGKTPLIARYAMLLGDKLGDKHLRYCRSLTIIWSGFFLIMALSSVLFAVFTNIDTWSFFTYVISYFLIGSFFVIEFIYRKHHFAGEIEGGFFQFILKIIKIRPTHLAKNK